MRIPRPRRQSPPPVEPHLLTHVTATVWGPAEFIGLPPWRLAAKGLVTGVLGAGLIVGCGIAGAWTGWPALGGGEAGLVAVAVLAVRLLALRAGRALIGIVVVLGVCLVAQTPQVAAGMVLAERGHTRSAVVVSVEHGDQTGAGEDRYLCSVTDRDGEPLGVRIWRGCGPSVRPGDALTVVYDPEGRVPPRGVTGEVTDWGAVRGLAVTSGGLVVVSALAVVRSFRLRSAAHR
ncbi:hypothetical protein [Streptomyces broussonetiae]|uniref:DUF3592 domain-containing protein n=1 Tax=Streptomyces broussonetiae TaxID=2686304 RepID=A0ABV5EMC1_9ACTN